MILDALAETIETLKKRIERHRQELSENETRAAASDSPLKRGLGGFSRAHVSSWIRRRLHSPKNSAIIQNRHAFSKKAMPMLDPLIEAIETVKKRIEQHRQTLSENETRTRGALINPILKALGWDPADPALVTLEYNVGNLRADYALHGANAEEKPTAVIEAKKLDEPLDGHLDQMIGYAIKHGIEYAGIVNGDLWQLYEVHIPKPIHEKRIAAASILKDEPHECALELLSLWRLNLASGKVKNAKKPVIVVHEEEMEEKDTNSPENPEPITPEPEPNPSPTPSPEPPPGGNWIRLSECHPQKKKAPQPAAICLPGENEHIIASWTAVLIKTAEWLCEKNHLTTDKLPVRVSPRSMKYIVSESNAHGNGREMRRPGTINNGRYYVDKNLGPIDLCESTRTLLKHCVQDPSQVYLKFATVDEEDDA